MSQATLSGNTGRCNIHVKSKTHQLWYRKWHRDAAESTGAPSSAWSQIQNNLHQLEFCSGSRSVCVISLHLCTWKTNVSNKASPVFETCLQNIRNRPLFLILHFIRFSISDRILVRSDLLLKLFAVNRPVLHVGLCSSMRLYFYTAVLYTKCSQIKCQHADVWQVMFTIVAASLENISPSWNVFFCQHFAQKCNFFGQKKWCAEKAERNRVVSCGKVCFGFFVCVWVRDRWALVMDF